MFIDDIFKTLTKYSKIIFFVGVVLGFSSAYLGRIDYHPSMVYFKDFFMVMCALGLAFWPRK